MEFNSEILPLSKVLTLKELLPTPIEQKTMKRYKGDPAACRACEAFFLTTMSVPEFEEKVDAVLYSLQFNETAVKLRERSVSFVHDRLHAQFLLPFAALPSQ